MPLEAAVDMIGGNASVRLPPVEPGTPQGSIEQFFVGFTHREPAMAQRIANTLAAAFIEEASMKRTTRAQDTATLYHEKLRESQARLNDLEGQRRRAQESYMGALPEQTPSNVALATNMSQQLTSLTNEYLMQQEQLNWIEQQLNLAKPEVENHPDSPGAPVASSAAIRVMQLEKELAQALNTYTENWPGIARLRQQLDVAKAEAKEEASRPAEQQLATLKSNPEYARLLNERENLKIRLESLQRSRDALEGQIATYRGRIESAPRVAQQMVSLDREYELEKQRYAELTKQLHEAELAEGVEMSRSGERFTIIAQAGYPSIPDSPDVPRVMLFTILGGICLGGALALGREYLDRSIYDARALTDLELPVLGEIPRISHV